MKISEAEFITSASTRKGFPDHDYPEVAMAGRSNVGKSSLINRLTNRKKLAITSSMPGRTRLVNFFLINEIICLVDLPGYGYAAKASKSEREKWAEISTTYLTDRVNLKAVVAIIDLRRGPTELDMQLCEMLDEMGLPRIFVATKVDKLKQGEKRKMLKVTSEKLQVPDREITQFSAIKDVGRKELWVRIREALEL